LSEREHDNDEQAGGRPGFPVDPLRLWNAIRKRWQLILIAGVVGAFLGAAIAKKLVGSSYEASGIITWNTNYEYKPEEREAIVESMLFSSNLEEVKKRLKLQLPASALTDIITVSPSQKSNNIAVSATWGSAEGAADLVNTLIKAFLEWRHTIITDRLKTVAQRYRDAVIEAEKRQQAAAQAYDDFRRESGISDISQERELAIKQAAEISAQTDTARLQAESAQRKLEGLKSSTPSGSDTNSVLTEADRAYAERDAKRLPEARAELERAKAQFSADHPNVRRLQAELEGLEARVKSRGSDPRRSRQAIEETARAAQQRALAAQNYQSQLQDRLNKLSAAEGRAVMLLGEVKVSEEALQAAKALLAQSELEAQNPPSEFRVLEQASPPADPLKSPRKNIAIGFPLGFVLLTTLAIVVGSVRKLDVRTPKEAAFWSNVPVVGASTWPRDPDMLSSLMHDLDDYAPHCEGVTLIVGASLDEAHLARRVAEWDGHRMVKSIDDPQRMLSAGSGGSAYPLARPSSGASSAPGPQDASGATPSNMQILTLTGPVPAQALRRAARLADRVLVVVASGKHSVFQLMKIQGRLGRDNGIGVLLVGLDKEFAMVRDRVGDIERFWRATRAADRA
jgi:uncharacterized protein involved in exopolysaccharide biosynthesis